MDGRWRCCGGGPCGGGAVEMEVLVWKQDDMYVELLLMDLLKLRGEDMGVA